MSRPIKIAVIGGSGLTDPDIIQDPQEKFVDTPFGKPSDALIVGKISGVDCVILARHGRNHSVRPTDVNYRGNIWALKQEGCTHVLATTACGSLQDEKVPGEFVIMDQFVDRTTKREQSFYDGAPSSPQGVCHIPMTPAFCPRTRQMLIDSAKHLKIPHHPRGTNITVEGPRFCTVAECKIFHDWGVDVINMTTVPEVVLAKEAGLLYASVAMVTDTDGWKEAVENAVSVDIVMERMKENAKKAKALFLDVIPKIAQEDWTQTIEELEAVAKSSVM